jgi:hypothetical protein
VTYPLAWPVTEMLERAGYQDSYRQLHPDPLADPGLTWPAARPKSKESWNPGPTAPADRIDYVMAIGPATATESHVVGEDDVSPWPSDHRGLVSTFTVTPATPPVLVAPDQRLYAAGEQIPVRFHTSGEGGQVTVAARGASAAVARIDTGGVADGSITFDATGWAPGRYDLTLSGSDGAALATSPVWIQDPDQGPRLAVAKVVEEGAPIDVAWMNAPGNRWDWIGIYRRGADPNVAWYLLWAYTDATIEGSVTLDENAEGKFPLPPGTYTAMLLVDDAYEAVATADFAIR